MFRRVRPASETRSVKPMFAIGMELFMELRESVAAVYDWEEFLRQQIAREN